MVQTRSSASKQVQSPPSTQNNYTDPDKKNRITHRATSASPSVQRQYQGKERNNGLPLDIKKQLIEDIEANGGIKAVTGDLAQDLARLLDKRIELYGARGDSTRKGARNFVQQLSRLHQKGEYQSRVLGPFGVQSFAQRQKQQQSPGNNSQSSSSDSTNSKNSNKSREERSASFAVDLTERFEQVSVTLSPPLLNDSTMKDIQEHVEVNLENPYANGSVVVFPLMGIKGNDGVDDHQGFAIVLRFDKRHVLRNMEIAISARIQTENRVVISGIPTEDYALLNCGVASLQNLTQAGGLGGFEYLIDGLTNANNTFNEPETMMFEKRKEIILQFPKDVKLNVSKINNIAADTIANDEFTTRLPSTMIAIKNSFDGTQSVQTKQANCDRHSEEE